METAGKTISLRGQSAYEDADQQVGPDVYS